MNIDLNNLESQAVSLLQQACSPDGIWASPEDQENYRRVWGRDSMIAGIAGLLANDDQIIEGLRNAILTLARYQHPRGMIPSNVQTGEEDPRVSYGSLAGRVDANTWFIVGSCLYLINYPDKNLQEHLHPKLQRSLTILDQWEFNANDLLYTPLSGNWADEYPVEGHTLYDNTLRIWALRLYSNLFEDQQRRQQAKRIEEKIRINFWPKPSQADHPAVYHQRSFNDLANGNLRHFACSIGPTGYNTHFDTAGHAMALLAGLASQKQYDQIVNFLEAIFRQVGAVLLPAFWPVITSDDPEWKSLKNNYSYTFKNNPHQYHNGGIWPVWMGWFALGASMTGNTDLPKTILEAWMKLEDVDDINFSEYIASDTLQHSGKERLCYSASGLIFLVASIREKPLTELHL
jgi:glycogen debranching enzyme